MTLINATNGLKLLFCCRAIFIEYFKFKLTVSKVALAATNTLFFYNANSNKSMVSIRRLT